MVKPDDEPGFDQVLERLRAIVDRLEQGNLPLEESLRTFEEGVALARQGHTLLDGAERRVEQLVKGSSGGDVAVPLREPPGGRASDEDDAYDRRGR